MTPEQREKKREMLVIKSNEMIRNGRFNLSLTEQRIILYMIASLEEELHNMENGSGSGTLTADGSQRSIKLDIYDFCEVCGIDTHNNLARLKKAIKDLSDKSMWIRKDNKEILIRWIEQPTIDRGASTIELQLNPHLLPYLIQLSKNFTQYQLYNVLAMQTEYSPRLYELLKSYSYTGRLDMTLEELRAYMCIGEKYRETKSFTQFVLQPALRDIEDYSDLEVVCEYIRSGKTITGLHFDITERPEDHELARAKLEGLRPSHYRRQRAFREFMKQNPELLEAAQLSLFDNENAGGQDNG